MERKIQEELCQITKGYPHPVLLIISLEIVQTSFIALQTISLEIVQISFIAFQIISL